MVNISNPPIKYDDVTIAKNASGQLNVKDAAIAIAKLKTSTGEVSFGVNGWNAVILAGGEYAFLPQIKVSASSTDAYVVFHWIGVSADTVYRTQLVANSSSVTIFARTRYVTSSGHDHWLFLLVDKITKDIISSYSAPDHPAYGNGGDFNKMPQPFPFYDETKHEIILVDNDTIAELKAQVTEEKSLLTLVNELYKPDMSKEEVYKPLHSGRFLGENPELVQTIPTYIKVRKLTALTQAELTEKSQKQELASQRAEQDRLRKEQARLSSENKLKTIVGLTQEEIDSLK